MTKQLSASRGGWRVQQLFPAKIDDSGETERE